MSDRAYLDHASLSPLRPAARTAMIEALSTEGWGDPSRLHQEALAARAALEDARDRVAEALGARPREVVFTSGAVESVAMVCWGVAQARGPVSVHSAVEHSAVRQWAARGIPIEVPVDEVGRIDVETVRAALDGSGAADYGALDDRSANIALVHCQLGNHEVGTRQPVHTMVEAIEGRALVHADASAAAGLEPIRFADSGVDLMSLGSHELGGPVGIGVLLIRRGLRLPQMLVGGDQERARRAGVEPVVLTLGFAAALDSLSVSRDAESTQARRLTDRVIEAAATMDGVAVHGDPVDRLAHIVCLGFDDVEPQPVLVGLDRAGIAVHSGSSCSSESLEPSPVLAAMGVDAERSLRVSVGWSSTDADVDRFLATLPAVLGDLRSLRG